MILNTPTFQLRINGKIESPFDSILTLDACNFIGELVTHFAPRHTQILTTRIEHQAKIESGCLLDFLPETIETRNSSWKAAPIPADLLDRRVEIVGPADCKTILNALNSGARVFVADFEDALVPTWDKLIRGQINLRDAINGTLIYDSPEGKHYELHKKKTILMMRPRGWHLFEKHFVVNGNPAPGSLVDFGLYFFHNAQKLCALNTAPYFYLPKLENHLEAKLWNDVFNFAQDYLSIPQGTIRASIIIETLPAAFEMDEILYELREHAAGLLYGCWDYIFSFIKCFHKHPLFISPERSQIKKNMHFLESFSHLLVQTCHRRGVHAIGGMATQLPNMNCPLHNESIIKEIKKEKETEVLKGYDGTWIGHPELVSLVTRVFDEHMPTANHINYQQKNITITNADLLQPPIGTITLQGLRKNIEMSLRYLDSWLRGSGSIRYEDTMESMATIEIARLQVWQWIQHPQAKLEDGRKITICLYHEIVDSILKDLRNQFGDNYRNSQFEKAVILLDQMTCSKQLCPFMSIDAYAFLE